EKFPEASTVLGTQMKSVGEVMAIGRNFKEALQKGLRSLETDGLPAEKVDPERLAEKLIQPNPQRLAYLRYALSRGISIEQLHEWTRIDPWFLHQVAEIEEMSSALLRESLRSISSVMLLQAKQMGFSDAALSGLFSRTASCSEDEVRRQRKLRGIRAVFKRVDTCGAEFESYTPYLYSSYEEEDEAGPDNRRKIMILGSGPNRIGQGIEFDYCCCHAAFALREAGYETLMVNCNPETVSTDYDTSDRLYFEPLTFEDVMNVVEVEKPDGVIVQFGGQTPLKLAKRLHQAGVPIIGTSPDSIDLAEDRMRFGRLLAELQIAQPENGTALSVEEAKHVARTIGFPLLVRPSYVLGGRAMVIVYDERSLERYMESAVEASQGHPVLIDKFLEDAFEYDVDAMADGESVVIGGIMEHIEEAGIHSGDSISVLPPIIIQPQHLDQMRRYTQQLGRALNVVGLMNIQFAVAEDKVYVLEVNPRASRTVPFVSKATGVPLAKIAAQLMVGARLRNLGLTEELGVKHCFIKAPVFPFSKFPGVDAVLGPEMKSTGEVMGVAETFGIAFAKAQMAAGTILPRGGVVFISVNQHDKKHVARIGKDFANLGFHIVATRGTTDSLKEKGVEVEFVYKVNEGRPNIVDLIKSNRIDLVVNTPLGRESFFDEKAIRRAATRYNVPCITTLSGARAAVNAIRALQRENLDVRSLQEYHQSVLAAGRE
ncbi:MAG: carbamoyl-phosphate synthase large subunit, partial [Acidobacteria bacterium]|nr:carbamoyl-phosphate synthase large subunit [Acidobacteriota bacterium]